jgi:hypothetical protein
MRYLIITLTLLCSIAHADQYYQDTNGNLHFLSTMDIANGGYKLLPSGATTITNAQAESIQSAQQASAAAAAALLPNPQGFIAAAKSVFGGPAAILSLPPTVQNAITLCIAAINEGNWADVQAIIVSQQAALNAANSAIYPAIKAAAAANNIPITL